MKTYGRKKKVRWKVPAKTVKLYKEYEVDVTETKKKTMSK